jgi:hypothetical protein
VPAQVPGSAVSVRPSRGVPEIVGGEVLIGAPTVTVALWLEVPVSKPAALVPVTTTRIVEPTSAAPSG